MSDRLVIEGVPPYDGSYPFDIGAWDFTTREWGWIKRLSGYLPLTVDEALEGGDAEFYACLACIALHRAGQVLTVDVPRAFDRFGDADFATSIRLEFDKTEDAEGDASPPPSSLTGNGATSGTDLTPNSAESTKTPADYGTPALDTSASSRAASGT